MSKFIQKREQSDSLVDRSTSTESNNVVSEDLVSEDRSAIPSDPTQNMAVSEPEVEPQGEVEFSEGKLAKAQQKAQQWMKHLQLKHLLRRDLKFWGLVAVVLGIGGGGIALFRIWNALETSLPESVDEVMVFAREGTMTIEASDGTVLQEIGPVTHEPLEIEDIPENVVQAFVASEDRRFRDHQGVDYQGILRAAIANLKAGGVKEGGSTITQQLARIVFLNQEQDLWRKLREVRISQKIEEQYSKDQILERYLNLVYLGSGAYGIADAAWIYFGKSVDELTAAEAATIAGITPAPSAYSPFENPEAALKRRNLVLKQMEEDELLAPAAAEAAIASPLTTNRKEPKRLQRKVPYFTDYIQQELTRHLSPEQLKAGGLTVETTINLGWQTAAEKTIENAVKRYGRYQRFDQAALVAIDPRNGRIKAMVGGKDYYSKEDNGEFNRVTQAKRQPGSTFKTFVYSTAIAAGFSPYRGLRDAEYVVDGYKPKNYDGEYRGWVSMRDALVKSINIPALQTLIQVGWEPTIATAKKMGIESELKKTYSLALGASEVTLLELTSAYGTLANKGLHNQPHGIQQVRDRNGNIIYEAALEPERALDEDSAAIMTWMLRSVVTSGTGTAAQIGRPAAGKTGTTDKERDLWFVGYIPQVVAGVWLGNDDNKSTWGASSTAAAVWRRFMLELKDWVPAEDFPDRPRKLEGREGTIETKPIKPKRSYYKKTKPKKKASSGSGSGSRSNSRSRSRSSSRSRSNSNSRSRSSSNTRSRSRSQSRQNRSSSGSRRTNNRSNSAPRRNSAPRQNSAPRRNSAPRKRQAAPAPAPAPAPVPNFSKPKKISPSAAPPSSGE